MTSKGKKIFLILTVVVPFLIYSIVYYQEKFRYANFKAKDFVSFEYKWGTEKNLENSYNSANGVYKYHDNNDSLIVRKLMLTKKDFKYLDSIADVQGFWNLNAILANTRQDLENRKILRYEMTFIYKNDTKSVTYLSNYSLNDRKKSAAAQMQKEIEQTLSAAEDRDSH